MPASDAATLAFYAGHAGAYAAGTATTVSYGLDRFLLQLGSGARILELGCGSGRDSAHMLSRGFDVTPSDGSPAMAREAERVLGRPVKILAFDALDAETTYDAVWANACLLHVPRPALADILQRIRAAIVPGGLFHASFKTGTAEGRDSLGRYYNYPSAAWLTDRYADAGWTDVATEARHGGGYDGKPTDWLHVMAAR